MHFKLKQWMQFYFFDAKFVYGVSEAMLTSELFVFDLHCCIEKKVV
jgi:hypothetical protein